MSDAYLKWKRKHGYPTEKGYLTGQMVGALTTFRTQAIGDTKRHGWAVGIKQDTSENRLAGLHFEGFERGTPVKGGSWNGSEQPERPVFQATVNQFLAEKFPSLISENYSIQHIWGK